ncbi:MAG: hypothetical protein ACRDSP_03535 [Pseudonocardiaceae bacterium]
MNDVVGTGSLAGIVGVVADARRTVCVDAVGRITARTRPASLLDRAPSGPYRP